MQVELVRTTTRDGVVLDGVIHAAETIATTPLLDAVICFSGVGTNFYGSELIEHLALRVGAAGLHVLRVNTRGHDAISVAKTVRGGLLQGAAYEIVDDCRHDVTAWIDFLVERGHQHVGLVGHSLGALKCLYAQAHEPHAHVRRIVAISPPCLSYNLFRRQEQRAAFEWSLATAQGYIESGKKDTLFRATFPFPLVISAATFLDKYGPGEKYNLFEWVTRIACPILFLFGERELQADNVPFHGMVEKLAALRWPAERPLIDTVAGANHNYVGQLDALASHVLRTIASQPDP